ncbi:MAG: TolC family protein [Proteobacteria bacterium]|nr:TolC family protein [Pseudomonadota bacterium]
MMGPTRFFSGGGRKVDALKNAFGCALVFLFVVLAQDPCLWGAEKNVVVGILEDGDYPGHRALIRSVRNSLVILGENKYRMLFPKNKHFNGSFRKERIKAFSYILADDPEVDVILSLGPESARRLSRTVPLKTPVMATFIEFPKVFGLLDPTTGKPTNPNWTTIVSPKIFIEAVGLSKKIFDFKKISYLCSDYVCGNRPSEDGVRPDVLPGILKAIEALEASVGFKIEVVLISPDDYIGKMESLETEMVFVGGLYGFSDEEVERLFAILARDKLPSITQQGVYGVGKGALMSAVDVDYEKLGMDYAKKIVEILDGKSPEEFSVVEDWELDPVFNKKTAEQIHFDIPITLQLDALLMEGEKRYEKLSLEAAVERGIKENHEMLINALVLARTSEQTKRVLSAYLPQMSASYTFSEAEDNATTGSLALTLQQNLFDAESNAAIDLARQSFAMAEENAVLVEQLLIENIILTFLDLMRTREIVKSREEHLLNYRRLKKIVRHRFHLQTRGRIDVLLVDMEYKNARFDMINAVEEFQKAKVDLNRLLKFDVDREFFLESRYFSKESSKRERYFWDNFTKAHLRKKLHRFFTERAWENSHELKLEESRLKLAALEKKQVAAKFFPKLQFGISWSDTHYLDSQTLSSAAEEDYLADNELTWTAQLRLSVPILSGGARFYEYREANIKIQEQTAQIEKTKADLEQNVKLLQTNHLMNLNRENEILGILVASRKNLELGKISYRDGQMTIRELLELQSSAILAEISFTNTKFQIYKSLTSLLRVIGNVEMIIQGFEHPAVVTFLSELNRYLRSEP